MGFGFKQREEDVGEARNKSICVVLFLSSQSNWNWTSIMALWRVAAFHDHHQHPSNARKLENREMDGVRVKWAYNTTNSGPVTVLNTNYCQGSDWENNGTGEIIFSCHHSTNYAVQLKRVNYSDLGISIWIISSIYCSFIIILLILGWGDHYWHFFSYSESENDNLRTVNDPKKIKL